MSCAHWQFYVLFTLWLATRHFSTKNFPPHFPLFICVFHCLTESRHNRNQSNKWPKQVGKKSNLLDLYRIGYKSNLLDFSRVELRLSRVERRQRHFLPVCACHTQTETETETQVSRRRLHLTRCGHVAVVAVAVVAAHLHAGYRLPATSVRPSPPWLVMLDAIHLFRLPTGWQQIKFECVCNWSSGLAQAFSSTRIYA